MNNSGLWRRRVAGFTLLELVAVMAVIAILATLVYPNLINSIRKSRRVDALQSLRSLQLAQERWRAYNSTYGTLANLNISATTPGGWYTLAISGNTATGYTATATAVAGKSQTGDSVRGISCATLTVNQDAPSYSPAGQAACWAQ